MKQILIVIPTYDEVDNIRPLIAAITAVFRRQCIYSADLLFVDDNSTDGTAEVIRELQSGNRNIHLLTGPKAGLGKAYIRGLTHGLQQKPYFAVIMMDADLSHDPEDIPALLAGLEKGADYVIGSRYVPGGRTEHGYSLFRRLQSIIANATAKLFVDLKMDVKDLTGGFKAIRRTSLEQVRLQDIGASGYVFQVNLLYEFAKRDYVIREVPITFRARKSGTSKLGLRDITEFLQLTYSLNPYSKPRRMIRFGTVGAIGTGVNLAVLVGLVQVFRLDVMIAYLAALQTSIVCNFFLNNWYTFKDTSVDRTGKRYARLGKLFHYNLVALGGATIAWLVFSVGFRGLQLHYVLADALGIIAAMSWNYWLSVRVVWPIIDAPVTETADLQHELQEA
jgi:dolichol-phosphate mannosyltransferase